MEKSSGEAVRENFKSQLPLISWKRLILFEKKEMKVKVLKVRTQTQ